MSKCKEATEAFCIEHGMTHGLPGDPSCEFEDGLGNAVPVEPEGVGGEIFPTGKHQRLNHSGSFVCDTCINVLNINIRWDQAPCRKLPVEGAHGGGEA